MTTQAAGPAHPLIASVPKNFDATEAPEALTSPVDLAESPAITASEPVELPQERRLSRWLYGTGFVCAAAGLVAALNPERVQTEGLFDTSTQTTLGFAAFITGAAIMGISKKLR